MSDLKKIPCKYGENCYQVNSAHHEKYSHPSKLQNSESSNKASPVSVKDKQNKRRKASSPVKEDAEKPDSDNINFVSKEMDITNEYNEVMANLSKSNYFEQFQKREQYSQKAEYNDLLKSPESFIRHKFFVEMPPDFYKFWEFCVKISKEEEKPELALKKVGLKLVGPFDCLAGKFMDAKILEPCEYLRHWRFYYDPPEFQTIFFKENSEIHYGYWRDEPAEKEILLIARNDSIKSAEMEFIGGNCFEAVLYYLDHDASLTPFNRTVAKSLRKLIEEFSKEHDIKLDSLKNLERERNKHVVCKTMHKAGIVVPFNRKSQLGYRNLIETDENLKKILQRLGSENEKTKTAAMEELQPIITFATIAVDECDFGTALELGIDLFCSGLQELHEIISQLLVTSYTMLKRPQFIAILKTHLENRKRGNNLSVFE